jgi:hypothetical protein
MTCLIALDDWWIILIVLDLPEADSRWGYGTLAWVCGYSSARTMVPKMTSVIPMPADARQAKLPEAIVPRETMVKNLFSKLVPLPNLSDAYRYGLHLVWSFVPW